MQKIVTHLWFDDKAEEAANFYVSIFKNSRIIQTTHYGDSGAEVSGQAKGSVMTVRLVLEGQELYLLNGGPAFKLNEATSLLVNCDTQAELDDVWDKLLAGGGEVQECGWLKDRYGLSWQVVPSKLDDMVSDDDPVRSERVLTAMFNMKKLDLAELEKAYAGS